MAPQYFLPYEMELFRTDSYYVLLNSVSSIWCNRKTGAIEVKPGWELANSGDPECLGVFYGVVGRLDFDSASTSSRLVLIKSTSPVGHLAASAASSGHIGTVHKICAVAVLHICGAGDAASELGLRPCKKHRGAGSGGGSTMSLPGHLAVAAAASPGGGHLADGGSRGQTSLAKTWGSIKSATSTIKNTTQQAAALATSQVKGSGSSTAASARNSTNGGGISSGVGHKEKERHERRILDEVQRIFTDTDSFYFSIVNGSGQPGDLTNTLQRHCEKKGAGAAGEGGGATPVWQTVDDRFFWNKHMLRDIIQLNNPLADYWILPIIQGFVQIETCQVEIGFDPIDISLYAPKYETFTISLLSRRSRHRAGTRYKRRGVDEAGKCANYVETEQIVCHGHHQVAFTQVRGSVPVYWSQPGYKYRPPPRLDKGEAETRLAFEKHFEEEVGCYGPICIVNLVEQTGKERVVWDAYTQHVIAYNSPQLIYATFDFHEYCRGMHFERVSVLLAELADVLHQFGFCWMDRQGIICRQAGVFRVNCIDCLDRTNVVQTALAKAMLQMQLTKLGLVPPEGTLPLPLRRSFQLLWANNGDIISKQYAGTNALKGDYTRTGERKLSGMMKDGMNSANRYCRVHLTDDYCQAAIDLMTGQQGGGDGDGHREVALLNSVAADATELLAYIRRLFLHQSPHPHLGELHDHLPSELRLAYGLFTAARYYLSRFKDVYRQATIDIMQGAALCDDLASFSADNKEHEQEEDRAATAEHVKLLLEDCKKMLISDSTMVLGAWGLIDADPQTGDPAETDMDTILILTRDSYYVADYDEDIDQITKYQKVMLVDVEMVELGPLQIAAASPSLSINIFNKARGKSADVQYCLRINYTVDGATGFCHTFRSTHLRFFNNVAVVIHNDDEMIESLRAISETMEVALQIAGMGEVTPVLTSVDRLERKVSRQRATAGPSPMTRNVSETQLHSLKNVGSKALSNVTQQFNKLNKLGHSFNTRRRNSKTSGDTSLKTSVGDSSGGRHLLAPIETAQIASEWQDEDGVDVGVGLTVAAKVDHQQQQRVARRSSEYFSPVSGIIMSSTDIGPLPASHNQHHHRHLVTDNITNESLERVIDSDAANLRKYPLLHAKTDLSIDVNKLTAAVATNVDGTSTTKSDSGGHTPEIVINRVARQESKEVSQHFGQTRHYSHSSGEVDNPDKQGGAQNPKTVGGGSDKDGSQDGGGGGCKRSTSEKDLVLSISSSQSETALKSMMRSTANSVLSSPSAVFSSSSSPFSKIARGVQSLGANLDPRKLKGGGAGSNRDAVTSSSTSSSPASSSQQEARLAEAEKLQRLWKNSKCKTRLIAV